ncbi:branched-chain amino acid ABC transporter permease [Marinobacter sp. M216]|uniref:Branched-chain amino acid ABC transporter permease n=1 Tax=Marinobacter albus TaxID=3030833 RepID=A0ABT7HF78_9GAMM|nr:MULTISPECIES: branched-chain amino acid ABC transporter permease [unclassified Marinobacter]MBW7471977.1 branched-chain amino acid ABC transporter permease [Marinobacter sp. F4218]MDK9558547.1 branched-chain amino acid ABC transporter permease [Marinobacter sp. M216]
MLFKLGAMLMTPGAKLALLVFAIVFPFLASNEYQVYVMASAFVWAIAVYGLNIITGFCGQLNLAHGGFFAIGAYTLGLLTADAGWSFWPAFVAALVVTAVLGFFVGIVSLRLKEHYFAIFTLCVGFIIYLLIDKWEELTHGPIGVRDIAEPYGFGLVDFTETTPFYYLVLAFLVFAIWFMGRLSRSLLGRTFIAIRNGDELAQSLGINLMRNKVLAFVLSTTYAGLAGALYAGMVRFIGPEEANIVHTFDMITYLLVGGIGTITGPLLGTVGIVWITQSLQFLEEYRMIIFGPLLVLLVIFFPRGITGSFLTWMHRKAQSVAPEKKRTESKVTTTRTREAENNA